MRIIVSIAAAVLSQAAGAQQSYQCHTWGELTQCYGSAGESVQIQRHGASSTVRTTPPAQLYRRPSKRADEEERKLSIVRNLDGTACVYEMVGRYSVLRGCE